MRALWKGEKIGSDVLKSQNDEENEGTFDSTMKQPATQLLDEGHVEANFFNPQAVESEKQKMV